jgi:cytochrome b6-f complex iron-sulfur subunit
MTRRDLIQKVLIGGVTFLVLPPVLDSCSKQDPGGSVGTPPPGNKLTLDLTNALYAALSTVGGFVITSQGIIVANTPAGYVAIDSTCTHQGCTIGYSSAANNFPCPCHGSIYSVTGAVVNGPATVALKSYSVSKSGNILTISL